MKKLILTILFSLLVSLVGVLQVWGIELGPEKDTGNLTLERLYTITARDDADFTADGANSNTVGEYFIATGTSVALDSGDKVQEILSFDALSGIGGTEVLGDELHTDNNAAADNDGEVNATTGWECIGCTVTSDSSVTIPGSNYSLKYITTGNGERMIKPFGSNWGLVANAPYWLTFWVRHIGTGGNQHWFMSVTSWNPEGAFYMSDDITPSDTTWEFVSLYFVYDGISIHIIFRENSETDDGGLYIDNFSCVPVLSLPGAGFSVGFNPTYGAEMNSGNLTLQQLYEITARTGVDFTADGAASNTVGTYFIATGTSVTLDVDNKVKPINALVAGN